VHPDDGRVRVRSRFEFDRVEQFGGHRHSLRKQ
jgi:hypothetical protein